MARKRDKGKRDDAPADAPSVVAHPRARRSIRKLRARAGLIGLVAVALLSLRAGVPPFDAVLRGLAGGVAAHFVAWGAGIVAWRHLVMAELAAHRAAQDARQRELREAVEQRAADALAANA
ncbi:MAG TPA: hypothetical protein VK631_19670 [Solirubrobacteraceae bacterium]|nr:hypothetical protein [Solirubrobacteraceae bacterium]